MKVLLNANLGNVDHHRRRHSVVKIANVDLFHHHVTEVFVVVLDGELSSSSSSSSFFFFFFFCGLLFV